MLSQTAQRELRDENWRLAFVDQRLLSNLSVIRYQLSEAALLLDLRVSLSENPDTPGFEHANPPEGARCFRV